MNDLRFAFRRLLKNPGFAAVAALTLALGIGANTAIFSLVDAVLLKSLPVPQPGRLYFITSGQNMAVSYPFIDRFQTAKADVGETFAYWTLRLRLNAGPGNDVALGQLVSGNYFLGLGAAIRLGRPVVSSDDQLQAPPVAVISHGCWERRFGRDPGVLGRTLQLNGVPFTIVGVTPREFHGLDPQATPEVFVPIRQHVLLTPGEPRLLEEYGQWVFTAVVRLKDGITEATAGNRLTGLYQQVISENNQWIRAQDLPEVMNRGVRLLPAGQGVADLREKFSWPLLVLLGASALVYLIACANVAGLLLARGTMRQREIAVRLALGASRARVARLLLAESLLLAGGGCVAGLFVAVWSSKGLTRFLPEEAVGVALNAGLDARLLAFSVLMSLVAAGLVALTPALRGSRTTVNSVLSDAGRIVGSAGAMSRVGKGLIVAQVALSLMLLVGAGLLVRSLRELVTLDPGFRRENVLLLTVQPELTGHSDADREKLAARLAAQELLERLEAIPGVLSASLSASPEFGGGSRWRMAIKPVDAAARAEDRTGSTMRWVSPKHFETLGIEVLRGRAFGAQDSLSAPRVAVINETMARQYFGNANPLAERFKLTSGLEALGEIEIVGIVRDTKSASLWDASAALFYLPFAQFPNTENLVFAVRCTDNPLRIVADVRNAIESMDPNLAITKATTLANVVEASLVQESATATLSTGFGVLALVLAAIGLYGAGLRGRPADAGDRYSYGLGSTTVGSAAFDRESGNETGGGGDDDRAAGRPRFLTHPKGAALRDSASRSAGLRLCLFTVDWGRRAGLLAARASRGEGRSHGGVAS